MNKNYQNLRVVKTLGCDIGNEGAKSNKGVFFPAKVYEGNATLTQEAIAMKVEWNGKIFIVGEHEQGVPFTSVDKIDTDAYNI